MKKFEFSIERLRRYQQQRLRLTELAMQQARCSLDQSMTRLKELKLRFDHAARASREELDDGKNLTHARRDTLERLRHEIRQAAEQVRENEHRWQQIVRLEMAERTRAESYDVLKESERDAYDEEFSRAEMKQLSESIMRTWFEKQGEGQE